MTDYRYDVFLSHKRSLLYADWLREYFYPLLQGFLEEDILLATGRPAIGVFFDKLTIEPGDDWADELRLAIRTSRCMVSLCSPLYFHSRWCQVEWQSFLKRAEDQKKKVLIPVAVHGDFAAFAADSNKIQATNFSEYVIDGKGFRDSVRYAEFRTELKNLSRSIAGRVRDAPKFAPWPVIESSNPPTPPPSNRHLQSFE